MRCPEPALQCMGGPILFWYDVPRNPKSQKFGFESGRVWLILGSGLSNPKPEIPRFSGSGRVSEIFGFLHTLIAGPLLWGRE